MRHASAANPFSTQRTRPGALPFLSVDGDAVALVVARLAKHHWTGQIIGPHGSGKSTLLEAIRPLLQEESRQEIRFTLHDGQRALPEDQVDASLWNAETLIIVDGYEQLAWRSRRQLARQVRETGAGLLVTAHADVGLPEAYRTQPSLEIAQEAARLLLANESQVMITQDDITACYHRCEGDVRETLFTLYDLYESRRK